MNHVSVSPTDGNGPTQGKNSDLVAQSVERRRSNPKVVGSIPTLVRVFLCPCVGPFASVGLALTWFIWGRYLALHITLYSVMSVHIKVLHGQRLHKRNRP